MDNQTTQSNHKSVSLPSIESLFNSAWVTFKGTWLQLLIFYLIFLGAIFGIIILLVILGVIFGFGSGVLSGGFSPNNFLSLLSNPAVIVPLIVLFLIGFIAIIIVSMVMQIGMIKIIGSYPTKKTLGNIFHESLPLILPLLGASFLVGFIVLGGYMVFIVPGILFTVYFMFVTYEVVLDNKRGTKALRSSLSLVSANFWGIVLRLLVLVGIYLIYTMLVFGLARAIPALSSLTNLISVPFGWFVIAYIISLYKELKSKTGANSEKSLSWIVIVAIIGLVLFVGLMFLVITNAKNFMPKPQNNINNMRYGAQNQYRYNNLPTSYPAMYKSPNVNSSSSSSSTY